MTTIDQTDRIVVFMDGIGGVAHRCPLATPDWTQQCDVCSAVPVVPATHLCGPCTFGEADTAHGNWGDWVVGAQQQCKCSKGK